MFFKHVRIAFILGISWLALISPAANAAVGLLAEPYLGWKMLGSLNQASGTPMYEFSGATFGGRVGVVFLQGIAFVGVDSSYAPSYNGAWIDPGDNVKIDQGSKRFTLGIISGISPPLLPLRFWIGLNFIDQLVDEVETGLNLGANSSYSGTSFKIGAGYRVIPLVSINLEYFFLRYSTFNEVLPGGRTNEHTDVGVNGGALLLSISAPITFSAL